MADTSKKTDKKQQDNTPGAIGATAANPIDPATTSPTIDTEAGVTMGDGIRHLHSLAKGDEDFINGTDDHADRRNQPDTEQEHRDQLNKQ
ncbi:hypothetical protein [Hymenobacter cellulosivorans]|uniref:Sigma-like protein n=1 Tax=Hymenobacter cellulosivorans TaxID=2932249 RepID=A0ABY4FGB1_9BACT|nr:hypothetical protein [Hymenobacter cellulosivorans]UOQ55047.1 hypothetical protein MUN80_09880 [Hymenobacter cellulosivorans]